MGLTILIYNIVSEGNYTIRYKSGDGPYPANTDSTFTLVGTYTSSTTQIELPDLEFDTQYWIKMTDEETGRYIIKNIYSHDSKAFPCYDTMCFSVDVVCEDTPTVTPTPTSTPTPSGTPTPTSTPTPTETRTTTPTPSTTSTPTTTVVTRYYQVVDVAVPADCLTGDNVIYVTFDTTNPAFLGGTPIINDYVTLMGGGYSGCWKVLQEVSTTATSTAITAINFGNCSCIN